jgi:hypothetical protein
MEKRKNCSSLMLPLALALLLVPNAHALIGEITGDWGFANVKNIDDACPERQFFPGGWISLAYVALVLSAVFLGFIYMATSAMHTPRLAAWCKRALYDWVVSAVVVSVFVASYVGLDTAGMGQLEMAYRSTQIIRNTITQDFLWVTAVDVVVNLYGNLNVSFGLLFTGINFSTKTIFKPISDALGIMINALAAALLQWNLNMFLLCFARTNMMAVLVPIAIFLRAFDFGRGAGNVLLAICASLLFVYPFLLTMNGVMLSKYFGGITNDADLDVTIDRADEDLNYSLFMDGTFPDLCRTSKCFFRGNLRSIIEGVTTGGYQGFSWGGKIGAVALGVLFLGLQAGAFPYVATNAIYSIMMKVAQDVFVTSFLLPLFNIFITLTFAKEFAKYLGSEVDLSAIEKLF